MIVGEKFMTFHFTELQHIFWYITGIAISSNCMRIQILFQCHNFNITYLLLKALRQEVVTFFLWCFNKNRICEQLGERQ